MKILKKIKNSATSSLVKPAIDKLIKNIFLAIKEILMQKDTEKEKDIQDIAKPCIIITEVKAKQGNDTKNVLLFRKMYITQEKNNIVVLHDCGYISEFDLTKQINEQINEKLLKDLI
jgi:hypothetical protein